MHSLDYIGSELELFSHAKHWKAYWAKQAAPYVGERVFDVGAGLGANLHTMYKPSSSWLCIEPDPKLAAQAEETIAALGVGDRCAVVNGTLEDVPVSEQADTIIYIDVLEHIPDDSAELIRARDHLRPGGHLIVLAPAHQWLFSPFDDAVGHCRRYTRRSLARTAPEGLRVERLRYLDSVGFFASAANKMLLRAAMPTRGQIAFWDNVLVPPSRIADGLLAYRAGKTVLGIWRKEGDAGAPSAS